MMLHAVEDILSRRLLETPNAEKDGSRRLSRPPMVTATSDSVPSLKPFARSLSHELRTPMHGVVGMLDLMYLTVQESLEAPHWSHIQKFLHTPTPHSPHQIASPEVHILPGQPAAQSLWAHLCAASKICRVFNSGDWCTGHALLAAIKRSDSGRRRDNCLWALARRLSGIASAFLFVQ